MPLESIVAFFLAASDYLLYIQHNVPQSSESTPRQPPQLAIQCSHDIFRINYDRRHHIIRLSQQIEDHVNMTDAPDPPTESQTDMPFRVVRKTLGDGLAARVGRLSLPGRRPLETPNFVAVASRGAVPHLTPDVVMDHTSFGAAYMAMEDCESRLPPSRRTCCFDP